MRPTIAIFIFITFIITTCESGVIDVANEDSKIGDTEVKTEASTIPSTPEKLFLTTESSSEKNIPKTIVDKDTTTPGILLKSQHSEQIEYAVENTTKSSTYQYTKTSDTLTKTNDPLDTTEINEPWQIKRTSTEHFEELTTNENNPINKISNITANSSRTNTGEISESEQSELLLTCFEKLLKAITPFTTNRSDIDLDPKKDSPTTDFGVLTTETEKSLISNTSDKNCQNLPEIVKSNQNKNGTEYLDKLLTKIIARLLEKNLNSGPETNNSSQDVDALTRHLKKLITEKIADHHQSDTNLENDSGTRKPSQPTELTTQYFKGILTKVTTVRAESSEKNYDTSTNLPGTDISDQIKTSPIQYSGELLTEMTTPVEQRSQKTENPLKRNIEDETASNQPSQIKETSTQYFDKLTKLPTLLEGSSKKIEITSNTNFEYEPTKKFFETTTSKENSEKNIKDSSPETVTSAGSNLNLEPNDEQKNLPINELRRITSVLMLILRTLQRISYNLFIPTDTDLSNLFEAVLDRPRIAEPKPIKQKRHAKITDIAQINCATKSLPCPKRGYYRYNQSCTKFYECRFSTRCNKFVSKIRTCPKCLKFNAKKMICDLPENVPECTYPSSTDFCTDYGQYVVPNNCHKYYDCKETTNSTITLSVEMCPTSMIFSEKERKCSIKKNCSRESQGLTRCASNESHIVDKFNCRKYYKCRNGKNMELMCPPGFYFNGHECQRWDELQTKWEKKTNRLQMEDFI